MKTVETKKTFLTPSQRIEHAIFIDNHTLIAMLKRCGHEVEEDTVDVKWTADGARVKWTTAIL